MKNLKLFVGLMSCMAMSCNAQSTQSSTDVRPLAPKGYVLFTEAGARAALSDAAELRITKKQMALRDSVIAQLVKIDATHQAIDKEQQAIINRQRNQNFWTNVKMYGGYGIALALLITRR
jgi:hypothetical protein